jgi:hypothetical protein
MMSGQFRASATLPPAKTTGTHWVGGMGWLKYCGKKEKNLALLGIEPRSSSPEPIN